MDGAALLHGVDKYNKWLLVFLAAFLGPAEGLFGSDKEYSIVIEGGTSETKLMVGVFEKKSGKRYLRKEELYETFTPGVLQFVNNLEGFREHIEKVLKRAEKFIPNRKEDDTPVKFRGTGVFRKLEEETRVALLGEVNKLLEHHKFKRNEYSTSILSDSDRGMYGWIAANLLADRFYGSPDDMVTTISLSDDSSYITFPLTHAFYSQFPLQVRWVKIAEQRVTFFTRRYPGLGIDAATLLILAMDNPLGSSSYYSPCISPENNGKRFKTEPYLIYAKGDSENVNTEECLRIIKNYIESITMRDFGPALNYKIYALSEFYYLFKDAGLLDESDEGKIAIDRIQAASIRVCNTPGHNDKPFLCLHLLYAYTLLTEGYKFPPSTEITAVDEVEGHHINWALGMSFYSLESGL